MSNELSISGYVYGCKVDAVPSQVECAIVGHMHCEKDAHGLMIGYFQTIYRLMLAGFCLLLTCSPAFGQSFTVEVVQPVQSFTVAVTEPVTETDNSKPVFKIEIWTATWCGACPAGKVEAKAAAKELGITYHEFDFDVWKSTASRAGIERLPTVCISSQKGIHERIVSGSRAEILKATRKWMKAWKTESSKPITATTADTGTHERNQSLFGRVGTSHQSRESLINHLLNDGIHRSRWSLNTLNAMSDDDLNSAHDDDHGW